MLEAAWRENGRSAIERFPPSYQKSLTGFLNFTNYILF